MEKQNQNNNQKGFTRPIQLPIAIELLIRLFVFLGATVLISVFYKFIIATGIFGLIANETLCRVLFCVIEILLMFLYWYYVFILSKISRHRTHSLKEYYIQSAIVFAVFSIIYALTYKVIGRETFLWVFRVTVNLIGFRFLTYAPNSLKYYMLAYLVITALIIALEPWIAKSRYNKWKKEYKEAIKNPGKVKPIPIVWQSINEINFRISVIVIATILISVVYDYLIKLGLFTIIKNKTISQIVFCVIELLLLVVYWRLTYGFSIISRFRTNSVKSYYIETSIVFIIFCAIYVLSYVLLSRETFLMLFRVTVNLSGIRFIADVPSNLKPYMIAYMAVMFLIMFLEPLIAWILYKRAKKRKSIKNNKSRT